jgi:regulatory protein
VAGDKDSVTQAHYAALALLVSREHSAAELQRKLSAKGHDEDSTAKAIQELQSRGLQSDERFAEAYVRSRQLRGYGPQRIQHQLRERGVSDTLIREALDAQADTWLELIARVRTKRFGEEAPEDYKAQAKQMRFLQYRGFSHEQIRSLFDDLSCTVTTD